MIKNNPSYDQVFWALGDNWWKQFYDGKYHHFGPDVFDQGLHGTAEPGYRASLKKSCEYASAELGSPLTIESYQKIHHLACQHFAHVNPSVINVSVENIDDFRAVHCRCFRNMMKDPYEYENSTQSEVRKLGLKLVHTIRWELMLKYDMETSTGCKKELDQLSPEIQNNLNKVFSQNEYFSKKIDIAEFFKKGSPHFESALESVEQVTQQLNETQKRLNLPRPFASLKMDASNEEPIVFINYLYQDPTEIEKVVKILIEDYHTRMSSLPSDPDQRSSDENKLALSYIAELFQNLEWLHPFYDGQGRTDLVLLAKLLTENGFNPSILYYPYYSTFEPLKKWITYLEKGMEAWRKERASIRLKA